ncbi:hypothetical protein [Jeotgalibaca caeni]|uniref:hypothetical protein n=1 Tax=Jeotgalibaca caeni TaxID=3028623 RepID=UPI00237DB6BB|nr:hypothetical protein [Jeotgalibaca caeni]MDE1549484.1 hypothetical protein [Jeotgalibaca caeni]
MIFSKEKNLPPMKYSKGQEVDFAFQGCILRGVIEITDFGGALEYGYDLYDIYVEKGNTLYKHVPEADIYLKKD